MARTEAAAALTAVHRQRQMTLTAAALRDLLNLWQAVVNPTDFATFARFAELAALLLGTRQADSAELARAYYAAFRQAEGVPGAAPLYLAPAFAPDELAGSLRAAATVGVSNALDAGLDASEAARNGFVRASGTATRLLLSRSRETLTGNVLRDRAAQGWQRVVDGDPCYWCAMLASRGAAFKSGRSARFEAHDHCQCTAEPFFEGSKPLAVNERYRALWDETTKGLSGAKARAAFRRALAQPR